MKSALLTIAFISLSLVAGAAAYIAAACPCEQMPGIALWGEEQTTPVSDWTFVNEAPLCQLQVSGGILPQSLNLNCMSGNGELFVSCSRCDGKRWSSTALNHPEARIQVGDEVYPVTLTRLTDPDRLDFSWQTRKAKLESFGRDVSGDRPDHWWSFQLESR